VICCLYVCVFKYFGDECGWLANVSKCIFIFVCFLSGFVWVLEFSMVGTGRNYCIGCYE
jgi:hypothetical protein